MKKIAVALTLILLLSAGTMFVFAETTVDEETIQWFSEKMDFRREDLKEALEDKEITQDEYDTWSEHFNYVEEFHEENGFLGGMGGSGDCHGAKGAVGRGSRGGMMRGYGWNN